MAPAILVGTRKGLFVLKGDEARREWDARGAVPRRLGRVPRDEGRRVDLRRREPRRLRRNRPALRRRRQDLGAERGPRPARGSRADAREDMARRAGPGRDAVARRRAGRALPLGRPRRELGAGHEPDRPSRPASAGIPARAGCARTRSRFDPKDPNRRCTSASPPRASSAARTAASRGRPTNKGTAADFMRGRPLPRARPVRPQGARSIPARTAASGSRTTAASIARTTRARTGSGSRTTGCRAASAFRSRSTTEIRTWRS